MENIITEIYFSYKYGTKGLYTPQQAEDSDYYGRDSDIWGVAQTLYFCLHGNYVFNNDYETLHNELQFDDEISEECKDFIRKMHAYNVQGRLIPTKMFEHPWLN